MPIEVVEVVAGDVISIPEIMLYVQAPTTADNELLQSLIRSSVIETQRRTGRKLLTHTINLWLSEFPANNQPILTPFPPLLTIEEITYIDGDDTEQTLDPAGYFADAKSQPGRVLLTSDKNWPDTAAVGIADHPHPVKVQFTCGYGDSGDDIPDDLKTIVKGLTKLIFDNPNPVEVGGAQPVVVPLHIGSLIESNKDQTEYPAGTW